MFESQLALKLIQIFGNRDLLSIVGKTGIWGWMYLVANGALLKYRRCVGTHLIKFVSGDY